MPDRENPLDKLWGERRHTPAGADPLAESTGLNPLALLELPAHQRDLVNWLSRRKQARFPALQAALGLEPEALQAVLAELKQAGHIHEALIDGQIFYRVVFGGKISRAARELPDAIWSRLDLDDSLFLRQVPLVRGLPDDALRTIAGQLDARRYRRNEVILWQGDLGEGIYLIKSGIVGIMRLAPDKRDIQILHYLKEGDLLGEFGLLSNQRTAAHTTATALSDVDVLLVKRDVLLDLLQQYPSMALELVQLLTQRLMARSTAETQDTTLSLVIGVVPETGCTMLGSALASTLAQSTQRPTVYTEHPGPEQLPGLFQFTPHSSVYAHPGGFDVFVPQDAENLPGSVRTTLMFDSLREHYANIVVSIPGQIDDTVTYLLEQASQVVLLAPPDAATWERLHALRAQLKLTIHPEKTDLALVCNRTGADQAALDVPDSADFALPVMPDLPSLAQQTAARLPAPLAEVASSLVYRLGRANQLGVYLPTHPAAAAACQDDTVTFFTDLFGDADRSQPHDDTYLVRTRTTKTELDRHLSDVLAYVETLKARLEQDVLAFELNSKVMVI